MIKRVYLVHLRRDTIRMEDMVTATWIEDEILSEILNEIVLEIMDTLAILGTQQLSDFQWAYLQQDLHIHTIIHTMEGGKQVYDFKKDYKNFNKMILKNISKKIYFTSKEMTLCC